MSSSLTRRAVLQFAALAAGGLCVGVWFPGCRSRDPDGTAGDANLYVRINPDNTIVVTIPRSEMGQGVRTTLALLVAEELEADWALVRVEQAELDPRFEGLGTGGSTSIADHWFSMREAGASLRTMLIQAAAGRWGVPAEECRALLSYVTHEPTSVRASFGELAESVGREPLPENIKLKPRRDWTLLGQERSGIDVDAITRGAAIYGLDVRRPGMLYAVVARPRAFGDRIRRYDAEPALAAPGVRQVVEIPAIGADINVQAGLAVVADHTWAALRGRGALIVEWDPGPHAEESSVRYSAAMRAAVSTSGTELINRIGDPESALLNAAAENPEALVSAEYELPFLAHATMEPMNCTAEVRDGRIELWAPTQEPEWVAGSVATALNVDISDVRVHVTLMGGGFGRRLNPDYAVEAALIAKAVGVPVQVVWTRDDDLKHDFYRPCALHRIDAVLGPDKLPLAWRHRFSTPSIDATYGTQPDDGWGLGEADGSGNMTYSIPHRSCEYSLLASGVPRGWWRAVSTTHGTFAVESMLDELAAAACADPVALRLSLISRWSVDRPADSEKFPFAPERLRGVVRLAAEKAGWGTRLPPGRAQGIACCYDHSSYCAQVFDVEVVGERLRILRVVCAADAGPILNPSGARAQIEGAVIQGLSAALHERITVAAGGVDQGNYDTYRLLRINETPLAIEIHFIETDTHPTGLGEPALPPVAPALANAIFRATGKRMRMLPFSLEVA